MHIEAKRKCLDLCAMEKRNNRPSRRQKTSHHSKSPSKIDSPTDHMINSISSQSLSSRPLEINGDKIDPLDLAADEHFNRNVSTLSTV